MTFLGCKIVPIFSHYTTVDWPETVGTLFGEFFEILLKKYFSKNENEEKFQKSFKLLDIFLTHHWHGYK